MSNWRHQVAPRSLSNAFGKGQYIRQLTLISILLFFCLASPAFALQFPDEWSTPVSLSRGYPVSVLPDVTADRAGNLYAIWDFQWDYRDEGAPDGIAFAMWNGKEWSAPVDISVNLRHLPSIAIGQDGRLHVFTAGGWYTRAWAQNNPVDAKAWAKPRQLTKGFLSYWSDIFVDNRGVVHIVYSDGASDHSKTISGEDCAGEDCSWVFYIRSADGGDTWSDPVKISTAMAEGGRVQIAGDPDDNLYVVWSTEFYDRGADFITNQNGFAYSLDHGDSWSEPETQLLDTGDKNAPKDYWLSVAADSQQNIHVITTGEDLVHLVRHGAQGEWQNTEMPPFREPGLGPSYGFRQAIVDSEDNLHVIVPTIQLANATTPPGLFHIVWNKDRGWSKWERATTNLRGIGEGLGNLVLRQGNKLGVIWHDHLEGSAGHLFRRPLGRIEVYYTELTLDSPELPAISLPPVSAEEKAPTHGKDKPSQTIAVSPTPTIMPAQTWNKQNPNAIHSAGSLSLFAAAGTTALVVVAAAVISTRVSRNK